MPIIGYNHQSAIDNHKCPLPIWVPGRYPDGTWWRCDFCETSYVMNNADRRRWVPMGRRKLAESLWD